MNYYAVVDQDGIRRNFSQTIDRNNYSLIVEDIASYLYITKNRYGINSLSVSVSVDLAEFHIEKCCFNLGIAYILPSKEPISKIESKTLNICSCGKEC